jgi:hypothetical protein
MSTGGGRRSCVVSISSTPSGCSSRPWAGRTRRSEPRKRRIAGAGWSSSRIPSSDWHVRWWRIVVSPGNGRFLDDDSLQRESGAGFGTSARRPSCRPVHRNPVGPDQDDRPARSTAIPHHVMTSARPSNESPASQLHGSKQVKQEA